MNKPQNKNRSFLLIIGLALVLASILLATAFRPALLVAETAAANAPEAITVAEAVELRKQGALVLDVRQPEEWEAGHIPGATLIPLSELPKRLDEIPDDHNVVVVCRSGSRSGQAIQILCQSGFNQTTSMNGGMKQWAASDLEIVTGP